MRLPTFAVIVPALPAAVVAAEIFAPSATVSEGDDMAIWPAFPLPLAVLNRPLLGLFVNVNAPTPPPVPTPTTVIAWLALILMLPAGPLVLSPLLVAICAPLVKLIDPTSICTDPALPSPCAVVLMNPESSVRRGAETATAPPFAMKPNVSIPPELDNVTALEAVRLMFLAD